MKAIFCGTPEIAVPALDALADIAEIVGVVCQPDRPAGRGMKMRAPAVKLRAAEMGLDAYQPVKVRDGSLARWMRERDADFALVIAYGRILTADALAAPRLGCVNLHASLLPRYRGAAPIQRALMHGEKETGVCLMQMDEGMDTGDVLACHRTPILEGEDAGSLALRLGELAAEVTRAEVPRFFAGELSRAKQDESRATHAPPLTKEDTVLAFDRPAETIVHHVRGLAPRPGASAIRKRENAPDSRIKILKARVWEEPHDLAPGEVKWWNNHLLIGAQGTPLEVLSAQPEGKKAQSVTDLRNGRALVEGDKLV